MAMHLLPALRTSMFVRVFERSLLLALLTIGLFGPGMAQGPRPSGQVAQRVEELRKVRTYFKPVSLFSVVAPGPEVNALWNKGCRTAEVLRFDRSAAGNLLVEQTDHIALSIPSQEGTVVLDLYRADVVTDDFTVRVASTGSVVRPSKSAHYRGSIRGVPGSIASVSLYTEHVMVLLSDDGGERILGRFDDAPDDLLVLYHERDLLGSPHTGCGTRDRDPHAPVGSSMRSGSTTTLRCVRWYWEVAHDIFQNKGGTANATDYTVGLFNQTAVIFANDGISVALQEVFVWDVPDPYGGPDLDSRLNSFQTQTGSFNGDMAHLLDLGPYGGVAADFATLCVPNPDFRKAYSGIQSSFNNVPVYSWSVYLVCHEQGHLLGSFHTHACAWNGNNTAIDGCASPEGQCPTGPLPTVEGGTIMSYCDFLTNVGINFNNGYGPQPGQVIRDHVNSSDCLFSCGGSPCDTVSITLSTTAGTNTMLQLSLAGVLFVQEGGESFLHCLVDGCYRGTITDENGEPVDGTYSVADSNNVVLASGTSANGGFAFTIGSPVNGCTDPTADNFDPLATCDDGTCCHTLTTLVLGDSGSDGWEGATYHWVNAFGDTLFTGTLATGASDTVQFCPPVGCYSFSVSAGADPGEVSWSLSVGLSGGADTTVAIAFNQALAGCADPAANNYNPNVTCPDGTCCYGTDVPVVITENQLPGLLVWSINDAQGDTVVTSAGDVPMNRCISPVCGLVINVEDTLINGSAGIVTIVEVASNEVTQVLVADGGVDSLQLYIGTTPGCTDPAATNYNPNATCDDGSCCLGLAARLILIPFDGLTTGTAHYVIDNAGQQFVGDLALEPNFEFGFVVGVLPLCLTEGCLNVTITPNNVALFNEASIDFADTGLLDIGFDPAIGAQGFAGVAPLELCDGVDNNCNGLVDEGFGSFYVDADGDGFGDPLLPIGCDTSGVTDNTDCDDSDSTLYPNANCNDGDPNTVFDLVGTDCTCSGVPFACAGIAARLTVFPFNFSTAGSVHYVIDNGAQQLEGDLDLESGNGSPVTSGVLYVCLTTGCLSVTITPNDVALFSVAILDFSDVGLQDITFNPASGLQAYVGVPPQDLCDGQDNDCDGDVDEDCLVVLSARVFLEGPYNAATGLMSDARRALGLLPTIEPYTGIGYAHIGGAGEETTPELLAISGNDAIVDWVVIELRSSSTPATIIATRSALVQRDGDVVDIDGTGTVAFAQPPGNYFIAVRHSNHLGCMTSTAIALNASTTMVDFTTLATGTFGTSARKAITGTFPTQALWAGDVTFNGQVKYTGSGNDRDPILTTVGSTTPNNAVTVYSTRDVNLNGQVKYTGSSNDRDPILVNVGSTTPNNVRQAQLP